MAKEKMDKTEDLGGLLKDYKNNYKYESRPYHKETPNFGHLLWINNRLESKIEEAVNGGGGGGIIFIERSLPDLHTDIANSALEKGATYKITGVHKAHSVEGMPVPALYDDGRNMGTTIYLTALSEKELSSEGYGEFYNPKYLKGTPGHGIFNNSIHFTLDNISGNFQFFVENVTADNGATAKIISKNKLEYISGDWANATGIVGDNSGASADITSITVPNYSADDIVFWGGYAWENLNGNIGVPIDVLSLDSEWDKLYYTDEDYYAKVLDRIEYDIETDLVLARYEADTNSFVRGSVYGVLMHAFNQGYYAISTLQWGMALDIGVGFTGNSGISNVLSINSKGVLNNVSVENNGRMDNVSLDNGQMYNVSLDNGQMYNVSLDNGYMDNVSVDNGRMDNVSVENNGRMDNVSVENNGRMDNVSVENNGRMYNVSLDNGQMYNVSLDNGQMNNVSVDNGQMNNVSFESFNADFQNVVYSGKTFQDIKFIGKIGVPYTIPDLNSATTIFDNTNCLHKEVFDAGGGVLNIRYWDVLANDFAIVNITN